MYTLLPVSLECVSALLHTSGDFLVYPIHLSEVPYLQILFIDIICDNSLVILPSAMLGGKLFETNTSLVTA